MSIHDTTQLFENYGRITTYFQHWRNYDDDDDDDDDQLCYL